MLRQWIQLCNTEVVCEKDTKGLTLYLKSTLKNTHVTVKFLS